MILIRSLIFWAGWALVTVVYTLIALVVMPMQPVPRYRVMSTWSVLVTRWLELTCGLRYQVDGLENLPKGPAMIMPKHQSAWETMALQCFIPPLAWVLKRELLLIPFFGWAVRATSPIAIDRQKKVQAQRQIMTQGRDRMAKGFWLIVFPEGTRVGAGERGVYKHGGSRLAADLELPVIPLAHNAGEFWPRNSLLKWPGTITVKIGKPIPTAGREAAEITADVEAFIEGEMERIPPEMRGPCYPKK